MTRAPPELRSHTVVSGTVRLRCKSAGPSGAPMALLLHGFPACWATWREPMRALADAGFFAVAPDLRGYGESDKPSGVEEYAISRMVEDVAAIVGSFGRDKACIVGHDWGGGVAWATAMFRPQLVARLATLNSVHPAGFVRQIRKWSQLRKSSYIFFFQLPWLPEWYMSRDGFRFLRRSLGDDGLSPEVVDDLLQGVRPPGALRAAIAWYRAGFRDVAVRRWTKVEVPTLAIWGDRDRYLDLELAQPPTDWVTHARVEHVPEASHWVHHDAPERVATLLIDHFRR